MENVWRVWGDSARCDLFLSKPRDVPTKSDTIQAAGKVLPMTFAALSISGISEILGELYRNVGTRSTGTGGKAQCPEGTPRVTVGMALAASTQASGKTGTEGNNKLAENLKIPLYCDLPKYHCNANAVVRRCFMDL